MKKIIETIKKHDNIIIVIIFAIFSIEYISRMRVGVSGDALWNFANVLKISNGYKIYQNVNVIVTPLFFIIGKSVFNLFGKNMMIYNVYGVVISTFLFTVVYNIFKITGINKKKSYFYTIIIIMITSNVLLLGANYNTLSITFVLTGILLEIKNNESVKYKILQGIVIFLIFFSKQNIVVLYLVGLILYKLYTNKNIRKAVKSLMIPAVISFGMLLIFLIYMYLNNNLYNFISYVVLGIKEFGRSNIFISYYAFIYIALISLYIFIITNKKIKMIKPEIIKKSVVFFWIGLPIIFSAWPIVNEYHFTLSIIPLTIGIIYTLDELLFRELFDEKVQKILIAIVTMIFFIITILSVTKYINNLSNLSLDYSNPYYGANLYKEEYEYTENIYNFVKEKQAATGKETIIMSNYANGVNIKLNEYNGDFDLPFLGNLGKDGENGLIEKIKKLKNKYILILDENEEEKLFWQESIKANEYIKTELEYVGKIENLLVYETKD